MRQCLIRYGCAVSLLVAAWAAGLLGCATPSWALNLDLPAPFEDGGLEVSVEGSYMQGRSFVGFRGSARNVSGKDLTMCSITFDIVDSSGAKVGDAIAHTQSLRSGQTWRFQALCTTPFATNFKGIQRGRVQTIGTVEDMVADIQAKAAAGLAAPGTGQQARKLGVFCEEALPGGGHVPRVSRIVAGGLAEKAGWQVGDLMLAVDGAEVRTLEDAVALTQSGPSTKTYTLQRGGAVVSSDLSFPK